MKILITGAANGIGLLTALTLANRYHIVYLSVHTKKEELRIKQLVKNMHYSNIEVLQADITNEDDCNRLLKLPFDCLINNAAYGLGGSVLSTDIDKMRALYEVNVFSSFSLLQKAYKKLKQNNEGRIIIMSSLTALFPVPFLSVYSSSKASISSLVKSIQNETKLLEDNIKFILIEPGMYHTGFNQYMLSHILDDKVFSDISQSIYKVESSLFLLFEKYNLTSIVIKIIKSVEFEQPKSVYRAPLFQTLACKLYNSLK